MPRLADHRPLVARTQPVEEAAHHARVEDVRRRQLHEQRPVVRVEPGAFREKPLEQRACAPQRELVRDLTRHFHGELKAVRRARCPFGVGGGGMRAIERGIDLGAAKPARVAFKMGSGSAALRSERAWNRPTRGADEQPSGHGLSGDPILGD